jgi:SSS family solute:Na+ symporter
LEYLNALDYVAIVAYLLIVLLVGVVLSRRASQSLEDYFLGGRKLPWWAMGMSGTASWFDITGTMLIVSFLYMLGPRGIYVEFRGGAVLVLAFMLAFTGKWHRRSGCITAAEWMEYRFGTSTGAQFARLVSALGPILMTIGMLAYLVKGVGPFLNTFIPGLSPNQCALIMIVVATAYTAASGFYGVVITDVIQTLIIFIAVAVVTTMAIDHASDVPNLNAFAQSVTGMKNWTRSAPSWHVEMPPGYERFNALTWFAFFYLVSNVIKGLGSGGDQRYFGARNERECGLLSFLWGFLIMFRWPMMMGFALLGLFLVNDLFPDHAAIKQTEIAAKKAILAKMGRADEFDLDAAAAAEQILPKHRWTEALARGESDPTLANVADLSSFYAALGPDWRDKLEFLIDQDKKINTLLPQAKWQEHLTSITKSPDQYPPEHIGTIKRLLGNDWKRKLMMIGHEGVINPERILPAVLLDRIPMGFRGLLLVALLAASMSTFDSTVNWAAGYFTRDVYQRFVRRTASNRELITASYVFVVAMVACGYMLGLYARNIDRIWSWIIMSLTAGMAIPLIIRLYWARFNAGGVVASTLVGLVLAFIQYRFYRDMDERVVFVAVSLITFAAAIIGTYLTKPTDPAVLEHFYKTTRPFGLWGKLKATLDPDLRKATEREHRNDMLTAPIALVWQVTLFILPMQLVIRQWRAFAITAVIFAVASTLLYKIWYKNLPPPEPAPSTRA